MMPGRKHRIPERVGSEAGQDAAAVMLHRAFHWAVVASFIAMGGMVAGLILNWPSIILVVSTVMLLVVQYPVAFLLHWRICAVENLSRIHLLLYLLNPVLAWLALFLLRKQAAKHAGSAD
jgi:hypothetical protein